MSKFILHPNRGIDCLLFSRACTNLFILFMFHVISGVIKAVASACLDGAVVLDLCEIGDKMILEETQKVFKKEKEMKKGAYIWRSQPLRGSVFIFFIKVGFSSFLAIFMDGICKSTNCKITKFVCLLKATLVQ